MKTALASTLGLLLVSASACGPGKSPEGARNAPPSSPAPVRGCTEIGCVDGLRVTLEPSARWPAGSYRFDLVIDGTATSCTGSLPLPSCDTPGLSCSGAGVQIGESGCALPPAEHGYSELMFASAPREVRVTISRDGQVVGERELEPVYQTSRPNGPECPPVCNSAGESWRVF